MDTGSGGSPDGVGAVATRLLQHLVALVQARADLMRREVHGVVRGVALAAGALLAALVLLLLLIPVAVATLILLLAQVVAPWIATGAVLLLMALVAAGLVVFARIMLRRRRLTLLRGLQEDWQAIRHGLEERQ